MIVSIIMPAYNAGKYIERTVRSVLEQTLEDFELLIVDDGSSDETRAVVGRLMASDSRIRLLTPDHAGASAARNLGVSHASGKYIYFMDSDDLIHREALSFLVTHAESHDAQIAVGSFETFTDSTEQDVDLSGPLPGKEAALLLTTGKDLFHKASISCKWKSRRIMNWLYLFNAEYWRGSGLTYEPLAFYEDLEIYPRFLFPADRVVVTDIVFYHYRLREGSASLAHRAHPARIDSFFAALAILERTFERSGASRSMQKACGIFFSTEYMHLLDLIRQEKDPAAQASMLARYDARRVQSHMRLARKPKYFLASLLPFMNSKRLLYLSRLNTSIRSMLK